MFVRLSRFVDVHIALENNQGELVGVVKNYAMKRPHGKVFTGVCAQIHTYTYTQKQEVHIQTQKRKLTLAERMGG